MRYISDDGLTSRVHSHMLDGDLLLSAGPVALERLDLRGECAGEFVECPFCAILLRDVVNKGEASRECH